MGNGDILDEFIQSLEDENFSIRTIKNNIFVLKPFVEWTQDRTITDKLVMEYLRTLKPKEYSDSTLYFYRSILKKFLGYISPEMARNVKLKMKKKEPPNILTQKEVEALIDACRNTRDRALISFLYESGCRKGELLSIRIENVALTEYGAIVTIPKGKTGSRTIPIVYSASYLRQWIDVHPTKHDNTSPLFCSLYAPHNTVTFSGLTHMFELLKERTGIKKSVYCHLFRHSRATHMATKYTEQEMKKLLGWTAGSDMAAVYVSLSQRDVLNAVLRENGIETKERENNTLKVEKCPRCKQVNPEALNYCGICGFPLKEAGIKQLETETDSFETEFAQLIAKYPNLIENLAKYKNTE